MDLIFIFDCTFVFLIYMFFVMYCTICFLHTWPCFVFRIFIGASSFSGIIWSHHNSRVIYYIYFFLTAWIHSNLPHVNAIFFLGPINDYIRPMWLLWSYAVKKKIYIYIYTKVHKIIPLDLIFKNLHIKFLSLEPCYVTVPFYNLPRKTCTVRKS